MNTCDIKKILVIFALSVSSVGCADLGEDDQVGLCYRQTGDYIETSCSIGNNGGSCATAGYDYTWYGDYDSFTACGNAKDDLFGDAAGGQPAPSGGGTTGSNPMTDAPRTCQYTNDGECDEGTYCPVGTDTADCQGRAPEGDDTSSPEPDNACWSGLHDDGRDCVIGEAHAFDSLGTPHIKLEMKNTCSGRVYGKFCNEHMDGTWDCGADGIRPGQVKVWSTSRPSGRTWFVFTGSNEWQEDWVCSSEAGISTLEP